MALDPAALATDIKSALDGEFGAQAHEGGDSDRQRLAEIVAQAVVDHLKDNAEIHSLSTLPVTHPMGPGTVMPFTLPGGTTIQ